MKQILLLIVFLAAFAVRSQTKPYNQWSVDFGGGAFNVSAPFAEDYSHEGMALPQVFAGVRYMFNPDFGTRLSLGYLIMESGESSNEDYSSTYLRSSLEGVANTGSLLGILERDSRFTILLHGGVGASLVSYDTTSDNRDNQLHLVLGLNPEYRITDGIALFADVSGYHHVKQSFTWDGTEPTEEKGTIMAFSLGVSISLGKEEKRADFYPLRRRGGGGCY